MDKLTAFLGFMLALSLATERITETIKGLPLVTKWLATEQPDPHREEVRKAAIHIVAIVTGTILAYLSHDQFVTALGFSASASAIPGGYGLYLVLGAMASGGSGLWNSALDIVRGINQQKQLVTDNMKSNAAAGKPLTTP